MAICSHIGIRHYVGTWPDDGAETVLLDQSQYLDERSPLQVAARQLVQEADYARAAVPGMWGRGNLRTPLSWTTIVRGMDADAATAYAMDLAASFPRAAGWVLLDIYRTGRRYVGAPAVIEGVSCNHVLLSRELHIQWTVRVGVWGELTAGGVSGSLATELGWTFGTEGGDALGPEV